MTIIVEGISLSYGGKGGTSHNDFNDIITNPSYGGSTKIKNIDIRSVEIYAGDVIDSIQFIYNVVTDDGIIYSHTGNTYGRVGGGKKWSLLGLSPLPDQRLRRYQWLNECGGCDCEDDLILS